MDKNVMKHSFRTVALASAMSMLASCGSDHPDAPNVPPTYLGAISTAEYDGNADDLLTAGLGMTGLKGTAPAFADPLKPTAAELRRNAIFNNYRAIVDISPNSGYGSLYGPNVDANGTATTSEGKIAGTEYLAYADDGSGNQNVTLMVQVPSTFDPSNACIITATSSGSRGVYGAIGASGEWGLKKGCAVAYADKGSGTGLYTFDDDGVNLQNGVRATRGAAGKNAHFAPVMMDAARAAFASSFPNRIAFKHAHSQQNPEKDWGRATLQSIEFAYYVLNQKYGDLSADGLARLQTLKPSNTIVIASSLSNGGGAALLAAEQDTQGLIGGVAVTEPQIQPRQNTGYTVMQGGVNAAAQGKPLYDYVTYAALYQPCIAGSAPRCASLAAKGLLNGADLAARQADAVARMHLFGWLADSDPLQAAHAPTNILVALTYANAYGRFSVDDSVCGFSFAATDALGNPIALTDAQKAASFATQSGIIGSVVYENSVGGAKAYAFGVSPSTGAADQSLDGFLCLRSLATGVDTVTGAPLTGSLLALSQRVRSGNAEVLASGNLHGKPAVIAAGRRDALVLVNHAARAYAGMNALAEGGNSKLRYIEVTNGNHFDILVPVLPTVLVPLHIYLVRALDAVYANLKQGKALPPSQVVRTTPRANAATPITLANVPPLSPAPAAADSITVTGTTVAIPD